MQLGDKTNQQGVTTLTFAGCSSAALNTSSHEADWNRMISASLPAVVSIKVNRVRAFDTATAGTVQATGFVVDREAGYILTNRHVAGPGPIVAEAIFQNNEEVPLQVAAEEPADGAEVRGPRPTDALGRSHRPGLLYPAQVLEGLVGVLVE